MRLRNFEVELAFLNNYEIVLELICLENYKIICCLQEPTEEISYKDELFF